MRILFKITIDEKMPLAWNLSLLFLLDVLQIRELFTFFFVLTHKVTAKIFIVATKLYASSK